MHINAFMLQSSVTESLIIGTCQVTGFMLAKRYLVHKQFVTYIHPLRFACLGLLAALTQSTKDVFREVEPAINETSSNFSSSSKCEEHFRLCGGATFVMSVDWVFIFLRLVVLHPSFIDRMELIFVSNI